MGKQANSHEDNVILFPGLVTRLVEKGMSSLKEKKYYDALKFFQQSTELEPTHPQARYGLVITNIELNRLGEAKKHCESMLREGIGQYYDILQVYVSLLIQLGDYKEVETLLETVISEEKLPPKMAESFYQLLEFSRQMTKPQINTKVDNSYQEENIDEIHNKDDLIHLLEQGESEQQWGALQKLSQINSKEIESAYFSFLKGDGDPVLKSYILQMLKELKVKGKVEVRKFDEVHYINLEELEDVFHQQFGSQVITKLEDELGQESPSLYEMVQHVWWHYLFALYPKKPIPSDIALWAAALHILGTMLMNNELHNEDVEEIAIKYKVHHQDVMKAVEHMKGIESYLFIHNNENT
ncbi:tetratricopeptide repeat protein [Evansella sp. AB-P1]|uniref:tetratricopeptide repeat protein n=1 Tax=Evansella sp. AB-P1 TaxID=3037653 RepID=UPI00241FC78B|nr:tetratricopeptide repeat protein [Evansella sp. AB-P1]MDG5786899.1 tetratricopeptide repeat protein [Evansella sp. AB-P1]